MECLASNLTGIINQTEVFDIFCIKLFGGPLVWAIASVLCACVGIPASMWLLWVLIQRQRSGLSNDVYMLNLTVMDLIFNIIVPQSVINFFYWRNLPFIIINVFLYTFNISGRPLFVVSLCVDCYIAVVHPIKYMKMKHSKYRLVVSALIWSSTLAYGIVNVCGGKPLTSYITLILLAFCLPTITFCDLSILHALRKPDPSGRTDVHPQKQRALQTITNSLIMTLVSYLPPLVVFGFLPLVESAVPQQESFCNIGLPSYISSTLGSTIMPLLQLWSLGSIQDLRRIRCARRV